MHRHHNHSAPKSKKTATFFADINQSKKESVNVHEERTKMEKEIIFNIDNMKEFLSQYKLINKANDEQKQQQEKAEKMKNNNKIIKAFKIKGKKRNSPNKINYIIKRNSNIFNPIKSNTNLLNSIYKNKILFNNNNNSISNNAMSNSDEYNQSLSPSSTLRYSPSNNTSCKRASNNNNNTSIPRNMSAPKLNQSQPFLIHKPHISKKIVRADDIERQPIKISSSSALVGQINREIFKYKRMFSSNPFLTRNLNYTKYRNIKHVVETGKTKNSQFNECEANNSLHPFHSAKIRALSATSNQIETSNLSIKLGLTKNKENIIENKYSRLFADEINYNEDSNLMRTKLLNSIKEVNKLKMLFEDKGSDTKKKKKIDSFQKITELKLMKKELDALSNLNEFVAYKQRLYFTKRVGFCTRRKIEGDKTGRQKFLLS